MWVLIRSTYYHKVCFCAEVIKGIDRLYLKKVPYLELCSISQFHRHFVFIHRFDLDQLDTADKYPERFTVMLNFKVSQKDRPPEKNYPWDKFDVHKLSPKILFSSKDELNEVIADYGKNFWQFQI